MDRYNDANADRFDSLDTADWSPIDEDNAEEELLADLYAALHPPKVAEVVLTEFGVMVRAPYSAKAVEMLKGLSGRWSPSERCWWLPTEHLRLTVRVLQFNYDDVREYEEFSGELVALHS